MHHLTAEQVSELRSELLRLLERLERSMKVTGEAMAPVQLDQTTVGRLSRIDSIQSQEMAKSLQEREQIQLAQIHDALRRMEEGTYGVCARCGAAIPFGRLLVVPESPTCAECG